MWVFLDDSIEMEFKRDYHPDCNKYPSWLWHLAFRLKFCQKFLLSYWWSAIRNCTVNFGNWQAWKLGKFIKVLKSGGEISFKSLREYKKSYRWELRQYEGGSRYYWEFYTYGKWNQIGWLNGNKLDTPEGQGANRFEVDLMKKK